MPKQCYHFQVSEAGSTAMLLNYKDIKPTKLEYAFKDFNESKL